MLSEVDGELSALRHNYDQYDRVVYGRSVSPNYVEDVITRTRGVAQENGNILHNGGRLSVVLSPEGRVVAVLTK